MAAGPRSQSNPFTPSGRPGRRAASICLDLAGASLKQRRVWSDCRPVPRRIGEGHHQPDRTPVAAREDLALAHADRYWPGSRQPCARSRHAGSPPGQEHEVRLSGPSSPAGTSRWLSPAGGLADQLLHMAQLPLSRRGGVASGKRSQDDVDSGRRCDDTSVFQLDPWFAPLDAPHGAAVTPGTTRHLDVVKLPRPLPAPALSPPRPGRLPVARSEPILGPMPRAPWPHGACTSHRRLMAARLTAGASVHRLPAAVLVTGGDIWTTLDGSHGIDIANRCRKVLPRPGCPGTFGSYPCPRYMPYAAGANLQGKEVSRKNVSDHQHFSVPVPERG